MCVNGRCLVSARHKGFPEDSNSKFSHDLIHGNPEAADHQQIWLCLAPPDRRSLGILPSDWQKMKVHQAAAVIQVPGATFSYTVNPPPMCCLGGP